MVKLLLCVSALLAGGMLNPMSPYDGSSIGMRAENQKPAISDEQIVAIESELAKYRDDEISRFEVKEIDAVRADLDALEMTVSPEQPASAREKFEADWQTLYGLDQILQKVHVI
jgi:hypothetical protein